MKVKIEFENFNSKTLAEAVNIIAQHVTIHLSEDPHNVYTVVEIEPEEFLKTQDAIEKIAEKNNAKVYFTIISN